MSIYREFVKSRPIVRVDEATHEVFGLVTDETLDSDGEVCDFDAQRPFYERWETEALSATRAAGLGDSRGNVRIQHDPHKVGGKVTAITYDDDARAIYVRSTPTPDTWPLIRDGFYPMYSQAGEYARRWCGNCGTDIPRGTNCPQCMKTVPVRYAAKLAEVSYVDKGSNPNATFQFVRSDGATELRKFVSAPAALGESQCDSTGFESDGQDTYIFIKPLTETDDSTGFEHDLTDTMRYFERGVLIPTFTKLLHGIGDDATGFENVGIAGGPEAYVLPAYAAPSMDMAAFNATDDSTGFE